MGKPKQVHQGEKGKVKKKGKLEPPDEAIDAIKKGQKKVSDRQVFYR